MAGRGGCRACSRAESLAVESDDKDWGRTGRRGEEQVKERRFPEHGLCCNELQNRGRRECGEGGSDRTQAGRRVMVWYGGEGTVG